MIQYKNFRPTMYDSAGLALSDQQDWLVLPVARNRDSGNLEQSNFHCALESLGGESDNVEVHRFGHWANGWFEIIIINPESNAKVTAEEIEAALANYPILDGTDYSEREWNSACDYWKTLNLSERIRLAHKFGFHVMASRRDEIPEDRTGELVSYLGGDA